MWIAALNFVNNVYNQYFNSCFIHVKAFLYTELARRENKMLLVHLLLLLQMVADFYESLLVPLQEKYITPKAY